MPLIIEEFASIHLRMVTSFGKTRILFDTPKHALNSLDGFCEVFFSSDAPLSSPAFLLVVVSKIVIWWSNVLDCVDIFDMIHYHFGVLRTNHEIIHMRSA
jgi:hypothetical protein